MIEGVLAKCIDITCRVSTYIITTEHDNCPACNTLGLVSNMPVVK